MPPAKPAETEPKFVLGRTDSADIGPRANLSGSAIKIQIGTAFGTVQVTLRIADGRTDETGAVMDIRVTDRASGFIPVAENIQDGIRLHMAGHAESQALFMALAALPSLFAALQS